MPRKFMAKNTVIEMAVNYFPSFLRSRAEAMTVDSWIRGKQYTYSDNLDVDDLGYGQAFAPTSAETNAEYENLRGLSPNAFAGLLVTTLSQLAILEGISRPGHEGDLESWATFQRNRWNLKSDAIHRTAIGHGIAFGTVLPGKDPLTGSRMSKMVGRSPMRMAAFYDDDDDEWATLAIDATPRYVDEGMGPMRDGWYVRILDAYVVHFLVCKGDGAQADQWTYIEYREHDLPVPPVARCVNELSLDGRTSGVIEPVLPLLRRIDQDTFDRLINQRFGAWQVRYIAGMAKPKSRADQATQALKLRVEDLLVSTDAATKFGVLPAGDIENQIKATDHDLRLLSAITQTPPHHLLGLSSNLQAEALAAATEGLQRKGFAFRRGGAGEFHEQMARLNAMAEGDMETATAWDLRARWKDTESGSMSQAADALGKLATQLKVPIEMLWERIPGWDDTDVQRAKELVQTGSIELLIDELFKDAAAEGDTGGNTAQ